MRVSRLERAAQRVIDKWHEQATWEEMDYCLRALEKELIQLRERREEENAIHEACKPFYMTNYV